MAGTRIDWVAHVVCQREATETVNGKTLVVDPEFMVCREPTASDCGHGPLLFTTPDKALAMTTARGAENSVVATFRDLEHQREAMRHHAGNGYDTVYVDWVRKGESGDGSGVRLSIADSV